MHRDGHELPVELTVTRVPLRDTWLFSAFVRDLTKQKRSEEEHRPTAEFLSAAQAVANVGSWEWDVATNVVTWSDEAYRLFGQSPGDPVALDSYLELIHSDDRESVEAAINQAFVSAGSFEIDHRVVHQDGSIRYLYGRGGVVSDASGTPTRMVGTVLSTSRLGDKRKTSCDAPTTISVPSSKRHHWPSTR